MIKSGDSVKTTIDNMNQEFEDKVDKTTTIANIPLDEDISTDALLPKLFKFTNLVSQVVDADGTVHPVSEEDYDLFDNYAEDKEDWGEWTEPSEDMR